jgi:hypothetical protein
MYGIGMVYLGQLQNGMSLRSVIFTTATVMYLSLNVPHNLGTKLGHRPNYYMSGGVWDTMYLVPFLVVID